MYVTSFKFRPTQKVEYLPAGPLYKQAKGGSDVFVFHDGNCVGDCYCSLTWKRNTQHSYQYKFNSIG